MSVVKIFHARFSGSSLQKLYVKNMRIYHNVSWAAGLFLSRGPPPRGGGVSEKGDPPPGGGGPASGRGGKNFGAAGAENFEKLTPLFLKNRF